MATKKPEDIKGITEDFLVIPADKVGWENFPGTDEACALTIAQAFQRLSDAGWQLKTTIYKSVGHYRDRPFLVFQRSPVA